MKIGYNAQILADAATGIARYAGEMLRALVKAKGAHELIVFGNRKHLVELCPEEWIVPTPDVLSSASRRIVWEQTILPILQTKYHLDVMYYPDHTAPLFGVSCKTVITVHDLVPFAFPEAHTLARTIYKRIALRRSAALASKIVAVSHATQNDCVRWLGIPQENIEVIYNGVHDNFAPVVQSEILQEVRERYGLSNPFILFVGTLEKRKNVERIIEVYDYARSDHGITADLVLAGGPGKGYKDMWERVERSRWKESIRYVGFVPDADLPALYSMAALFFYPSLYEGFGLPVVEAMACGCPVITSNTTSLPEIVGDAGIIVDPYDTSSLAAALAKVLNSEELQHQLRLAGRQRARLFSWQKASSRLMSVFESLTNED
jgi:glycosyltransferase involved in cell wall biosynthesis